MDNTEISLNESDSHYIPCPQAVSMHPGCAFCCLESMLFGQDTWGHATSCAYLPLDWFCRIIPAGKAGQVYQNMAIERVGKVDTICLKKRILSAGVMETDRLGRIRHDLSDGDSIPNLSASIYNTQRFRPLLSSFVSQPTAVVT